MDYSLEAVLVAVIIFIIAVLIFLFAAMFYFLRRTSKRKHSFRPTMQQVRPRTVRSKNSDLSSIITEESATFDPALNRVSMAELLQATQNFSTDLIIGDGSFGLVYKANLSSGVTVALKRLSENTSQGLREFRAEIEALGKIRHPNIIQILGYCVAGSERVLVYEYIERGGLDQWLHDLSSALSTEKDHGEVSDTRLPLSWETRIRIIKGVAMGLAYMHNLAQPIIHRDIKAGNILLDKNYAAYIADFGLARFIETSHSHVSTLVAGTMGYMPPEYFGGTNAATTRGDVYSFGILALEIITGRKPHSPFPGENLEDFVLIKWVNKMIAGQRYMEMVDANIFKGDLKENVVIELVGIAMMCASEMARTRPAMDEVVELLDKISA